MVKNPPTNAGDMGLILVWEDPTGCGATKPMHQTIEPTFQSSRATRTEPLHKGLEPVLHSNRSHHHENPLTKTKKSPCSLQLEKARMHQ